MGPEGAKCRRVHEESDASNVLLWQITMIASKIYEIDFDWQYISAQRCVMLLRFEVSNHRSFLEPVELSMIAVDEGRPAARTFELLKEKVLTVAGVYGPNASGKSNVLDAIAWLSEAVKTSLRGWDDEVPRDPHRYGSGTTSPTEFELDILVDAVRHQYRLEVDTAVRYESLHSYPKRKRRMLFERVGDDIEFREGYKQGGGVRDLLTPTTLALSAAIRLDREHVGRVGRAVSGFHVLGLRRPRWRRTFLSFRDEIRTSSLRLFEEQYEDQQLPLPGLAESTPRPTTLLQLADPGIDRVEFLPEDDDDQLGRRSRVRFVHSAGDEPPRFTLEQESAGTQTWFRLIGPVLWALSDGGILVFDEIDASLHPRLSARLVQIFQDPDTNPRGAQLIFTTHDVSLLNHLNRDEVWLAEKNDEGMSQLVALVEYSGERVRKSINLERAYLQGRFGAVPQVDQISVRRALGLIDAAS